MKLAVLRSACYSPSWGTVQTQVKVKVKVGNPRIDTSSSSNTGMLSALPPIADIRADEIDVRQVPLSDIRSENQVMTQATVTSRTIAVEHIKISSKHSFEEVRQKLEGTLPKFDRNIAAALSNGDMKSVKDYEENGPTLSIVATHDHGANLQIVGRKRNALLYEIGAS
jgi:hypothetical protein